MALHSLLIVGEASDGPESQIVQTDYRDISQTLYLYGESNLDAYRLYPSSTGALLSEIPLTNTLSYYQVSNGLISEVGLYNVFSSGSIVTFDSPALTNATNGWFRYLPVSTNLNSSLVQALKESATQSAFTAPEDNYIYTMRIVGANSTKATGSIGPITVQYIYPGTRGNNWSVQISNNSLCFYTPINNTDYKVWEYRLTPPTGVLYKNTINYYDTIESLKNAIILDQIVGNFPFNITIDLDGSKSSQTLLQYSGIVSLSGGTYTSPTVKDYINRLDDLELELYDVICIPGFSGREVFPYAQNLFDNHIGYPFSLVCPTSGSTTDSKTAFPDCWQSDRLHLVAGTMSSQYSASRPFTVPVATLLSSQQALMGLGTRKPIAFRPNKNLSLEGLEQLASFGICMVTSSANGPVLHKGRTTDTSTNPTVTSCYRGVCRSLIPSLYNCIGNTAQTAHALAEAAVGNAFSDAATKGCPILDFSSTVLTSFDAVTVSLDMRIAGHIESINAVVNVTGN